MSKKQQATAAKLPRPTEADIARACDELAMISGWVVERYEQGRATRITEGLPDRRYVRHDRGLRVWVELKRPRTGKLTRAQLDWLVSEQRAGALATAIDSVQALARVLGLAITDGGGPATFAACVELTQLIAGRGMRSVSGRARARGARGCQGIKTARKG